MSKYWAQQLQATRRDMADGPPSSGYGEWAAGQFALKNEFAWPPHWRRYIVKIAQVHNVTTHEYEYQVLPRNPEWVKYSEKFMDAGGDGTVMIDEEGQLIPIPPMNLDPITFASAMEIDEWARVCARLDGKPA